MTDEKLLPCPFCLSEKLSVEPWSRISYYVLCENCCASGSKQLSEVEAIDAWNTRA